MAQKTDLRVLFCCLHCEAIYSVAQTKQLFATRGRFTCTRCNALVHSWWSRYSLKDWTGPLN
jgi:hypothetical protein